MEAIRQEEKEREVLRSRTRSGRLVTLGTASAKGKAFASTSTALEAHKEAHKSSVAMIEKNRREFLGED